MSVLKKTLGIVLVLCMVVGLFAGCSSPERKIIGSWRDSSGLTGYDFKEDNICNIVYVDADVLGKKITAAPEGKYSIEKADDGKYYITITYTLLAISMTEKYEMNIEGETLTLTDTDDGSVKTFVSYSASKTTTTASSTTAPISSAGAAAK